MGYLPEAVNNYLLRLGWRHGDAAIIYRDQAVQWFGLANVGPPPSRFALPKLSNLNGHYLREAANARLAGQVPPPAETLFDTPLAAADRARLTRAMDTPHPPTHT